MKTFSVKFHPRNSMLQKHIIRRLANIALLRVISPWLINMLSKGNIWKPWSHSYEIFFFEKGVLHFGQFLFVCLIACSFLFVRLGPLSFDLSLLTYKLKCSDLSVNSPHLIHIKYKLNCAINDFLSPPTQVASNLSTDLRIIKTKLVAWNLNILFQMFFY